jgi:hypothetical protein
MPSVVKLNALNRASGVIHKTSYDNLTIILNAGLPYIQEFNLKRPLQWEVCKKSCEYSPSFFIICFFYLPSHFNGKLQVILFIECHSTPNRTASIRYQCRKTTVLRCHRCLINTRHEKNEQHLNIELELWWPMSLSKRKYWYSNICLHFLKNGVPFNKPRLWQ